MSAKFDELGVKDKLKTSQYMIGKVIMNKEINRIQFSFDGKPDEETRDVLKSW